MRDLETERYRLERYAYDEAEKLRRINMEKLEAERAQQVKIHDERDRALHDQLRKLDRDEEERRRNRQPLQYQEPVAGNFEHFADGDIEYSALGNIQISKLCDDLFDHPPIIFTAEKKG